MIGLVTDVLVWMDIANFPSMHSKVEAPSPRVSDPNSDTLFFYQSGQLCTSS